MKSPKKEFEDAKDRWSGHLFKKGRCLYDREAKKRYDENYERIFRKEENGSQT